MLDTGLFFTEERTKTIIFLPNKKQAFSILVPVGNPAGINDLDALDGKIVSTEFGSIANSKLIQLDKEFRARGMHGMTVHKFGSLSIAYQALRTGQVQAMLAVDAAAHEYEARGTSTRALHGLFPVLAGLGFKNRALAENVLSVMQDMKRDGSYDRLLATYGIDPFTALLILRGGG